TLRMHADLISWSGPPLLTMPNYPAASSFARKEALYKRAIAFFDRGQAWEYAIQYSKELVGQYEFVQYDYEQVAEQLSLQAKFHRLCLHEQRFFSEYFRVGYYGMGLPLHVRNRAFIYRGFELERMGEFVQRIQKRYPNAALLNYTDPPPPSLLEAAGQFLQIFTVKPLSKLSKAETSKMPLAIQEYHNYNNINTFLYSKPFRRRDDDPSAAAAQNEFEDLWIANYTFTSADSFPTIHRRSEIIATVKSELNPLEYAIQQVEQKSLELGKLISQYQDSKEQNISPFTMVLSGAIDAAVSGGTDNFKKAFFTSDYAAKRPDHADLLKQLKTSLHSQMSLLEVALSVHGSICPSNMADLQSHLESKLASLKNAN
ncbi:MAG: hypothetical protein Q8P67_11405, partial [archaeon]|nr:hypothetical protein [archaeon]